MLTLRKLRMKTKQNYTTIFFGGQIKKYCKLRGLLKVNLKNRVWSRKELRLTLFQLCGSESTTIYGIINANTHKNHSGPRNPHSFFLMPGKKIPSQ